LKKENQSPAVLVTGAAGFIGSNLSAALLERGYRVIGLDDLSHGSLDNLSAIREHEGFEFVRGGVETPGVVSRLTRKTGAVVHLAALKIPRYGGALETLMINVDGTRAVIEACRGNQNRLFLASTSDVYGKNPELPFNEESALVIGSPKVARWSYAVSKLFDEQLFFAYRERHRLQGTVFRFFGSYGPCQHLTWWGGPQSVFIQAVLENREIEIHGDGLQTRSFCYVSDTVRGIVLAMEHSSADGEILNIGNDREITIRGLAEKIWKLCGRDGDAPLKFIPYASFKRSYEDVRRRIPDLSRAKRLLGYTPRVGLDEGLARTISWQKKKSGLTG
jgi:UDP-glucose 4-epimerase